METQRDNSGSIKGPQWNHSRTTGAAQRDDSGSTEGPHACGLSALPEAWNLILVAIANGVVFTVNILYVYNSFFGMKLLLAPKASPAPQQPAPPQPGSPQPEPGPPQPVSPPPNQE